MIRNPNFFKGELKYLILKSLCEQPLHGYLLMKKIQDHSLGLWKPTPGALYPALEALKAEGLIEIKSEESGGRFKKIYRVSADGKKKFRELSAHVDEMESLYVQYKKDVNIGVESHEDMLFLVKMIQRAFDVHGLGVYRGTLFEFASLLRRGKVGGEMET
ncbi:MAG TPA: PadR family transcriptional regulator, partial [Candidatus Diapherotrites archaeon]|nr:PadR family transcriptional regulator [Candidatus Diapherotrites archaeon]